MAVFDAEAALPLAPQLMAALLLAEVCTDERSAAIGKGGATAAARTLMNGWALAAVLPTGMKKLPRERPATDDFGKSEPDLARQGLDGALSTQLLARLAGSRAD